jgi:hypothetical protein
MKLWPPGISGLDREAVLVVLRRVCVKTGEALAGGVVDKRIAVRAVIPAQPGCWVCSVESASRDDTICKNEWLG